MNNVAKKNYAGIDDDKLLDLLHEERQKFTQADELLISHMTDELQRREVYPLDTIAKNPNSVKSMVSGYGAYWHRWRGPMECRHCKTDLRDHEHGPPFKREIGVESNDSIQYFQCPDCSNRL